MTIYSPHRIPAGYYVYAYLREDGTPYYIGKGKKKRAWQIHENIKRPLYDNIVILEQSLTEIGDTVPVGFNAGRLITNQSKKGLRWFNNGKENRQFKDGTQLEGFVYGRVTKK